MRESAYQPDLIKKIKKLLPGAIVIKNDPRDIQGFPDLLVLFRNRWAALETKASPTSSNRPNQKYYINQLGKMSFASFINPENEGEVLSALQSAFRVGGKTRVPKS